MRFGNILALCAFTLLAGCATGGARYADVNVGAPKLAPDRGRIYFYRSAAIVGVAVQPDIKLNGESVGSAAPGGFFFVDRPRGNYVASSATEVEAKLAFTLAAGETKYVRTSISPGIIVGHMNFELISKSVAEGELASLNQTASTTTTASR
jgi:Protein of unknown function (DUF2846)